MSESNPFQGPGGADVQSAIGFRSNRVLTSILVFLLVAYALCASSVAIANAAYPALLDNAESVDGVGESVALLVMVVMGLGTVPVLLMIVVLWCVWTYRAATNARVFGAQLTDSPGWAVGNWFIPFVNLIKPYNSMKQLYQSADPDVDADEFMLAAVPALFPAWWFFWIASNMLSNLSFRLGNMPSFVHLTEGALDIAVASTAAMVLLEVSRRQDAKSLGSRA